LSSITAIALSGMNAAQSALQTSAHNIANLNSAGFARDQVLQTAHPLGGVNASVGPASQAGSTIETDVVGLLQAKNAFLANLAVFKTGDRMTGSLIDALG
jgi:flagellar hook protein FlgE